MEAVYRDGYKNAPQAAHANDILLKTLQNRANGGLSLFDRAVNGRTRSFAIAILSNAGETRTVGPNWPTRFVADPKRLTQKQTLFAQVRKEVALSDILGNMARLHAWKVNLGTTVYDTWNMDETGFRISGGKSQFVASTQQVKNLIMVDLIVDTRNYVTSVECINGTGEFIPPLIILRGKLILEKWGNNDLDGV